MKKITLILVVLAVFLKTEAQTNIFPDDGHVGIGTTSPLGKLHVKGEAYIENGWLRIKGRQGVFFHDYGGGFNMIDNTWIRTYGDKNFYHKTGIMRTDGMLQVGGGGSKFLVNTNGNVGIGTTSPDSKLTVQGHVNIGGTGNYKLRTRHIDGKQTSGTSVDDLYLNYGTGKHVRVGYGGQDSNVYISGKVGIGTTSPTSKLTVNGVIEGSLKHKGNYFTIYPYSASYDDGSYVKSFYDGNNKQIRFWNSDTNTTYTRLETGGLTISSPNPINSVGNFSNRIEFKNGGHAAIVFHPGKPEELMFGLHANGNFYWGTGKSATKPNYYSMFLNGNTGDLGIRGKLTSNEVKVKVGGWSDFVFESHYNLPTLQDVEQHIKDNGHLKDIPSAKDVAENGILLGDMNAKLLQKIEELTLYTIQQEKEIQSLKRIAEDNKKLNERLLKLEALLLK